MAGVLIIAIGAGLQFAMPNGFPLNTTKKNTADSGAATVTEIHSSGPVRINEMMTSNGGVLTDESGATPDWIEIANVSSSAVNLSGYTLSKSADGGTVFTFPDCTLQPGECAIVIADSRSRAESGSEFHAPFRLSSSGDVLMLFNSAGVAVDTVNIPAITRNHSYARISASQWAETEKCTPGVENTDAGYLSLTTVTVSSDAILKEIVCANTKYAADANGIFHDYIVIANKGGQAMDISGWYLSDSTQSTRLWEFPEGTSIPSGGELLVYASGQNSKDNSAQLHTSFRLGSEKETVVLSNENGQPVDIAYIDLLKDNAAYMRAADGSWTIGTPNR